MERPDPVERPVLVFDFGSQYVQLIARRGDDATLMSLAGQVERLHR